MTEEIKIEDKTVEVTKEVLKDIVSQVKKIVKKRKVEKITIIKEIDKEYYKFEILINDEVVGWVKNIVHDLSEEAKKELINAVEKCSKKVQKLILLESDYRRMA